MKRESIPLAQARAIALAAQGFARGRTTKVNASALARVIDATQLFQIDSVSVVVRAHYMPLFSRLGQYDRAVLDEAAWGKKRTLFEYWAHEASLVPLALHPFLRWRMQRASQGIGMWKPVATFGRERRDFIAQVLARIRDEGPTVAGDFEQRKSSGGFWGWSDAKRALEWLFWAGKITAATRRGFERIYDLPERVLPREMLDLPTPSDHDAHLELTRRAVKALGVGTRRDIRDYFRTSIADTDPCIAQLLETGELVALDVVGLKGPYYCAKDTKVPRGADVAALLAPFDPVVWQRQRTHDLFGFHYRLEIYTPAHKRTHGYYVLPFLLGDRLVARVDLKTDRKSDTLQVIAVHAETHTRPECAEPLARELRALAQWLDVANVVVGRRGNFARPLAAALRERDD